MAHATSCSTLCMTCGQQGHLAVPRMPRARAFGVQWPGRCSDLPIGRQCIWPSLIVCGKLGYPICSLRWPLEASAPYHMWLQGELEKTLRERTALPGAETFHLAHLLFQVAEGLLAGTNSQGQHRDKADAWKHHVFSSRGPDGSASGEQLVTEMFARLEFQDGKRRRHTGPSQSYHGSGRAHLHMLAWLKGPEKVAWKEVLRADLPAGRAEPELRSLVEGSQLDWEKSGWPQREGPIWTEGRLLLPHPADAHTACLDAGRLGRHAVSHGRPSRRWPRTPPPAHGQLREQI